MLTYDRQDMPDVGVVCTVETRWMINKVRILRVTSVLSSEF
jgi:hypothetical protein